MDSLRLYPDDEQARAEVLSSLELLDTPPEERFDRLCRQAQEVMEAPATYISLIDRERQWFKATVGMGEFKETPRPGTFCDYAIRRSRPTVVLDATSDPLFTKSPYVVGEPHVRFYLGFPLTVRGQRVGTLCSLDFQPRDQVRPEQMERMRALARIAELELAGETPPDGETSPESEPLASFEGHRQEATILAARLPQFSSHCESWSAEMIARALFLFTTQMLESTHGWGGLPLDYGSDTFRAVFGPGLAPEEHATRAAGCALEMQHVLAGLSSTLVQDGLAPLDCGIALATDELVVGQLGANDWARPLVTGRVVGLAERIRDLANPGEILGLESTIRGLGEAALVEGKFRVNLPGYESTAIIYELVGVGDAHLPRR